MIQWRFWKAGAIRTLVVTERAYSSYVLFDWVFFYRSHCNSEKLEKCHYNSGILKPAITIFGLLVLAIFYVYPLSDLDTYTRLAYGRAAPACVFQPAAGLIFPSDSVSKPMPSPFPSPTRSPRPLLERPPSTEPPPPARALALRRSPRHLPERPPPTEPPPPAGADAVDGAPGPSRHPRPQPERPPLLSPPPPARAPAPTIAPAGPHLLRRLLLWRLSSLAAAAVEP